MDTGQHHYERILVLLLFAGKGIYVPAFCTE